MAVAVVVTLVIDDILNELSDKMDDKTISLRFYDQGEGIDLKDSEKIFERLSNFLS